MEKYKKGGYTILDLESSTIYADSVKALDSNKPVVVYDGTNKPYFTDTIVLDGTNVVITKGGKTITIANDNTITSNGNILVIMENIVDSQGNNRFVEGDVTTEEIAGVTFTYGRWSLSGTHLMIVLAGTIASNTSITEGYKAELKDLPTWILNKIYPTSYKLITAEEIILWGAAQTSYQIGLDKDDEKIKIYFNDVTTTENKYFRVQFDLLIDTE